MNVNNLEYRMYGLVPYNLSPIQQGIQFGHAAVEYGLHNYTDESYQRWANNDKTFIILNGGTTNDQKVNNGIPHGTLNQHIDELMLHNVKYSKFREPDLQNAVTAVVFLVDERVWDREKYPDFEFDPEKIGPEGWVLDQARQFYDWKMQFSASETGADHIVWLRNFLRGFKLA